MKSFSKIFCIMAWCVTASSAFAESQNYLVLDNGYRWDKITNRATLSGPTITVKGSTQTLKRINSYQLGLKGQWTYWDCVFVRGSAHYGWVGDGKYVEGGFTGKADGHTYDFNGAFGTSFCLTPNIWISPLAGWSYDVLDLNGSHIRTAIDGEVFHLKGIGARQRFNGPYLGFDLVFEVNPCLDVVFAYELHFAHWRGQRNIHGKEYGNPPFGATTGFSNRRSMNSVWGNVFKLVTNYNFCDCWVGTLGLKYQFYEGSHGRYKQTKIPIIPQFTHAQVDGLWWNSFAVTVSIVRLF